MNDAQTWTVIGGFFAVQVFLVTTLLRAVRAEIRVVSAEFRGEFKALTTRLDTLDRDVQRLYEHLFGQAGS